MGFIELDGRTWSEDVMSQLRGTVYQMKKLELTHCRVYPDLGGCPRRYYSEIECRVSAKMTPFKIKLINGCVEVSINTQKLLQVKL